MNEKLKIENQLIDYAGVKYSYDDYIEWDEPHEIYKDVIIAAKVKDVIDFQRQYFKNKNPKLEPSDVELLEDHMIVHWAWKRK